MEPHTPVHAGARPQGCHPQPLSTDVVTPAAEGKGQEERQEKRGDQEIILTGRIKKGSVSPGGKTFFS